jgi:hypothetical protein
MTSAMEGLEEAVELPETIDYTTGAMLIDLVAENDWAGGKNLQPRQYFNMLYSYNGAEIDRIAAKLMYWPDELRTRYSKIKSLEKRKKLAFRDFSNAGLLEGTRSRGVPTRYPGGRGGEGDLRIDEMMRMRMGH